MPPPTEAELQRLSLPADYGLEEQLSYVSAIRDDDFETHTNCHFPNHRFTEAVNRVSRANKKLIDVERCFFSEEGIEQNDAKYLGVAPGKWLGERIYRPPNSPLINR